MLTWSIYRKHADLVHLVNQITNQLCPVLTEVSNIVYLNTE